jgi:hypothetical protein
VLSRIASDRSTVSHVSVSFNQQRALLRVVGHVTSETIPLLDTVYDTHRQHSVTEESVDLTGVTVVDRHGTEFLATKRQRLRGKLRAPLAPSCPRRR